MHHLESLEASSNHVLQAETLDFWVHTQSSVCLKKGSDSRLGGLSAMDHDSHETLHHEAESQNVRMTSTLWQRLSAGTNHYIEKGELEMDRSVTLPLTFYFGSASAVSSAEIANLEISRSDHFAR